MAKNVFLLSVNVACIVLLDCSIRLDMIRHLFQIIIVFSFLVFSYNVEGQTFRAKKGVVKSNLLQIPGMVKLDKGDPSGVLVKLINLDSELTEKSVTIPSSGKFDFELSYFKEYRISFSKDGYYDKEINISTVIPRNVWEKDSVFPPYFIPVLLHKKVEGATLSFEGKPVGKVSYSQNGRLDNFDSVVLIDDKDIQQEISNALKNVDDKEFNQKMAEALDYEKKNDLSTAYSIYSVASKIKPSDKFVKEKLKELAADIKNLGNEAKIQAEFNRLIALGDANMSGQKFNEAIQYFKDALKVKSNDPIAVSKLSEAEKQLALAGDKAKKDAEFNRLIAAGDVNIGQSKYAEAIVNFKSALDIKPADSVALARLAEAEKQLALAGDKAKKDAEFNRLIAAGDVNIGQSKYAEAIINFKSALDIKPADSIALARLAEAEKQLAMAGDKAKKDAEFNRLIAAGDESVKAIKYNEAITSFKTALNIRPADSVALARIANAENLLALAGDKAKKDAEFNRLIAAGDVNVGQSKYADAIVNFKVALNIKPADSVALARLAEAEKQLALAGDKAKKDAEFSRLIAAGDVNVGQSKYADAIVNFKSALDIKPADSIALARLAEAEKQLALAGDKAKKDADFNRLIAAGDVNIGQSKYADAISSFKAALNVKPADSIARSRLAEAEKQLAMAGDKAKKDAEFNRLIASGDVNIGQSKYADAISSFKAALNVKPGDSIALSRISDAEKQLALAGDKAKKDIEFNRLIAAGDVNVGQSKYADAIVNFKSALDIKPADSVALARLAEAEKQLALAGDKEKKDAEFNRLIAAGDVKISQSKYADAISSFKAALNVKPGDLIALSRISDAEKQLALAGDKAKKDAEFNLLIAAGDVKISQSKYADAIVNFKAALDIKPADSVALARLAEAEKQLALAGDKEKKDAEFNRLLSLGDASRSVKKYAEALTLYKSALELNSNEVVNTKITETERLIKQAEADLLAREQENSKAKLFNDAMVRGGAYFIAKQYPDAISAYREAQKIKPSEILPPQKIKEIQSLFDALAAKSLDDQKSATDNALSANEKLYLEKINNADENYKKSQWTVARFYYIEALKIKRADNYSIGKIDACDKMIDSGITADKMLDYKNKIDKADNEMKAMNFSSAKFYYRTASDILKWETYPQQQLREIDRMVAEKLSESDQRMFTESLKKADEAFISGEYPVARFYYNKAIEISPSDHVTSRLKEIESIVNGSESRKINAAYDDFVKRGDEAVKQKNNSIARFYFQKASDLKPNENYPKEELKKIDSEIENL